MNAQLTVIICTYNRAHIIDESLEALRAQTASTGEFTILVVDNNSTDNTRDVVIGFAGKLPNLTLVSESRQGLSHARNRGLDEARTEWVAFLDDDAKAHAGWVDAILKAASKDDFDAFGGPFNAWHRFGPPPRWLPEDFGAYAGPGKYGPLGEFFIIGCNCAFKKSLAQSLGGFPTAIGMAGNKCAYGEETQLFNRMKAQGHRLGFVPAMLVDHCVLPYKYTVRWRLAAAFAHGRDAPLAFDFPVTLRTLLREGWHLFKSLCKCPLVLLNSIRRRDAWQRTLLECVHPVLSDAGSVITMIRLLAVRKG